MLSLGLDIGGANTKAILLRGEKVEGHWFRYIPLWKEKENLRRFLEYLIGLTNPEVVGVTMTAELCDIFDNKRKGVTEVIETVHEVFGDPCLFMSRDGILLERRRALTSPEKMAAANWVASALIVGRKYPECLLIDVGSTTTDLIPLKAGRSDTAGLTDFQRLKAGELVYTGILRTPLPFVCSRLRLGDKEIGVASEKFAITADVYRVLEMLEETNYTCETPDNRGKDVKSCMQRIARVLCSDVDELGEEFMTEVAKIFHAEQVAIVARSLEKVMKARKIQKTRVVGCGIGRRILAENAARAMGLTEFIDLAEIYGDEAALMTPAFGVGILAMEAGNGRSRS